MDIRAARVAKLRTILEEHKLEVGLLYSTRDDSRWSKLFFGCGCNSPRHYLRVSRTGINFLEVSYRAGDLRQRSGVEVLEVVSEDDYAEGIAATLRGIERIGIIGDAPWRDFSRFNGEIVDLTAAAVPLTACKSPQEIEGIFASARSLTEAMKSIQAKAFPGISEISLAVELRTDLFSKGEALPFPITLLSGDRLQTGTVGVASARQLSEVDAILLDAGVVKDGWVSDCTRMWFLGAHPLKDSYSALQSATRQTIEGIRVGMSLGELRAFLEAALANAGLPAHTLQLQDLGHGLGFSLHEFPNYYVPRLHDVQLEEGWVFTLEPEIQVGKDFLRIEEMIAIEGGRARILTE